MDKFSKWTGLAHSILATSHPKIKLNQARECLAAWLGHRTYASLRVHDLDVLLGVVAKYVVVDTQAAIVRANGIGFPVTREHWHAVEMALKPSGISGGLWLIDMQTMLLAARLTFEDQPHPDIDAICTPSWMRDNPLTISTVCQTADVDIPPLELRFTVHGEVRVSADQSLAFPVIAQALFKRVGLRLYAEGELLSVRREGELHTYEPDFDSDGELYGMLSDD
ncbi:MAG: hypothetical protein V4857_08840 [Pseudomonadota bacterium]